MKDNYQLYTCFFSLDHKKHLKVLGIPETKNYRVYLYEERIGVNNE